MSTASLTQTKPRYSYNSKKGYPSLEWMTISGIIFGCIYCFAIGANDVANSFGSSVSAKSLTIPQAILIAVILEAAGAILLGANVTNTIRSSILKPAYYVGQYSLIMTGMLAALIIGSFWLLLFTYLQMPVSTTHTIVASICGFTYTAKGFDSISWPNLRVIFIAWGASPSFTFCIAFAFFFIVKHLVLRGRDPYARACIAYPVIVGIGIGIDLFLVLQKSNNRIISDSITGSSAGRNWIKRVTIPSAVGSGVGAALITFFIVVPLLKKRIERKFRERLAAEELIRQTEEENAMKKAEGQEVEEPAPVEEPKRGKIAAAFHWFAKNTYDQDLEKQSFKERMQTEKIWSQQPDFDPRAEYLFQYVQIFTACLTAFAHGANDVANGMGPLSAIMNIQKFGWNSKAKVDYWVLAVGGILIGIGFVFFGYRIIKAVGYKITKLSPSRGACLELATAIAVAVASYLSIPVSTTQCLVGATAGVAFASGGWRAVDWVWLIIIGFSWAGVFFLAAIFTGLFMWLLIQSPGFVVELNYNFTEYK
jgi:solute carrier family 20 (sodium-dependent phosphate transporter)